MHLRWPSLAVLVLSSSCRHPAPLVSSGFTDYPSYVSAMVTDYCQHQIDCGFLDEARRLDCQDFQRARQFPCDAADALARRRVSFDAVLALKMLDAVHAAGCTPIAAATLDRAETACGQVLHPQVPTGGSCATDLDCVGGSCPMQCGAGGCANVCAPLQPSAGLGSSCQGAVCLADAYCKVDLSPTGMRIVSVCTAPGGAATACNDLLGLACAGGSPECKPGLVCAALADYNSGTCSLPSVNGAACFVEGLSGTADCAVDLVCDPLLPRPTCAPLKKLGEACGTFDACAPKLVCAGLLSQVSNASRGVSVTTPGHCEPPSGIGGPCLPGGDPTGCQDLYACDELARTCRLYGKTGDPCSLGCLFGFCDAGTNRCRALVAAGGDCDPTSTLQCQVGLSCDGATRKCIAAPCL